jgi:plastocyanin
MRSLGVRRTLAGGLALGLPITVAAVGAGAGFAATSLIAKSGGRASVSAGPPAKTPNAHLTMDGFYPTHLKVRVGTTVSWAINGFHTISFLPKGMKAPALIVPDPATPVSGQLDAAGTSFWFNGRPGITINGTVALPAGNPKAFDGRSFLNSGVPNPSATSSPPFQVTFTKVGVFKYQCLVHPGMTGQVTVVPATATVPSAAVNAGRARTQYRADVKLANTLAKVRVAPDTVLAGHDTGRVAWLRFFPSTLTVKAGTAVTFKSNSAHEPHTITIGPDAYTGAIETNFVTVAPNPMGPPTFKVSPLAAYPSDPPPLPTFTGANHGNGFENGGIIQLGAPPNPTSVTVTFSKPGTYHYECVIHQGMDGTIVVTS